MSTKTFEKSQLFSKIPYPFPFSVHPVVGKTCHSERNIVQPCAVEESILFSMGFFKLTGLAARAPQRGANKLPLTRELAKISDFLSDGEIQCCACTVDRHGFSP